MRGRRIYIFMWLLLAGAFCRAEPGNAELTSAEYRAKLEQLLAATAQLDSSTTAVPAVLHDLPQSWKVHTEQQTFDIAAEGLRRDVRQFEEKKNAVSAITIRTRIKDLLNDLNGFEKPTADTVAGQKHLSAILARPEFHDVSGPTYLDRLKQKLLAWIVHILETLFRSSAIPTISKFFVYGLIGFAVFALGFLAYRYIRSSNEMESVVPTDLPVSAKDFGIWLAEAHAAAAQGKWRDAIHLAYWAGISFLEQQATWRPDRARTPREYLRLLSDSSRHRESLVALTRIFELTWYAKRGADEVLFSQTLQALERLGCRPS